MGDRHISKTENRIPPGEWESAKCRAHGKNADRLARAWQRHTNQMQFHEVPQTPAMQDMSILPTQKLL